MKFNKTLDIRDYEELGNEVAHTHNVRNHLHPIAHRFEHQHRAWEYGLAMKAIRDFSKGKEIAILDVGGGGSVFAPAMAWLGNTIVQVDPGDCSEWVTQQKERLGIWGKFLSYEQTDFFNYEGHDYDVVTCLSVIEHVPEDKKFFEKLLSFVKDGGLIILTTDFFPTGTQQTGGHIRTYNEDGLKTFIKLAKKEGFEPIDKPDYSFFSPEVNGYTFAAMVLKRKGNKSKEVVKKTTKKRGKKNDLSWNTNHQQSEVPARDVGISSQFGAW